MSQESNASSCLIEYGTTFQNESFASQFSLPFSHVSAHDGNDESDDQSESVENNILANPLVSSAKIVGKNETNCDNAEYDDEIDVILKGRNSIHQSTKHEDSAFLSLQELLDKDDSDCSIVNNDQIEDAEKDTVKSVDISIGVGTTIPTKTPVSKYKSKNNEIPSISTHDVSHTCDAFDQSSMITPALSRNMYYTQTPATFASTMLSMQKPNNTVESIIRKQQKQHAKKEKLAKTIGSSVNTSAVSIAPSAINYDDAFSKRLLSNGKPLPSSSNVKNISGYRGFTMSMLTPLTNKSKNLSSVSSQWKSNQSLTRRDSCERNESESKTLTQAQKLARATQCSSLFDKRKRISSNMQYNWNNDETDQHAFGPTFLSKKKRKSLNQDIIDIEDKLNTQSPTKSKLSNTTRLNDDPYTPRNRWSAKESNHRAAPTSPYQTPPRSSKKSQGPLSRLLNSMRRSIDADSARLQSGMFAYHPEDDKRIDVNNPRNRAETIMDITIVGDNPKPFVNDETKIVVLGYVHDFFKNKKMIRTVQMPSRRGKIRNIAAPHTTTICDDFEEEGVIDNVVSFHHPEFAWICFTREKYFELSVSDGKQLRLYNPIVLESFGSNRLSIVIGTKLCEVHPMGLPQLSKVPTTF